MATSLVLSLLLFVFLLGVISLSISLKPFSFQAKPIKLSPSLFYGLVLSISALFAAASFIIVYFGTAPWLQILYYLLFLSGIFLNAIVLSDKPIVRRLLLVGGLGICLLFFTTTSPWSQNLLMAISLLWVGPSLVQRLRISTPYLLVAIGLGALADIYSVCLSRVTPAFDDSALFLNGIISVGDYSIGLGDFAFASLVVALLVRERNIGAAWLAAVLIAFVRFGLRIIFPWLGDIPYVAVIAALFLVLYIYSPLPSGRS